LGGRDKVAQHYAREALIFAEPDDEVQPRQIDPLVRYTARLSESLMVLPSKICWLYQVSESSR
jgi:hypothetical protein